MSTFGKGLVGFLVARPLIALLIAAAVVGVLLLTQTHRQKTRSPIARSVSGLQTHSR